MSELKPPIWSEKSKISKRLQKTFEKEYKNTRPAPDVDETIIQNDVCKCIGIYPVRYYCMNCGKEKSHG